MILHLPVYMHELPSKHLEIRLDTGIPSGQEKQIVMAGGLPRCTKQEGKGSGVNSVGKSRLFPAQLHPLSWSMKLGL